MQTFLRQTPTLRVPNEGGRPRHHRRRQRRLGWLFAEREFVVLCAWLIVVFLFGGGARADIASLLVLRPLSLLVLAYAAAGLRREHIAGNRVLLGLAAAWVGLHLLQLVPLPPAVWQTLPGRGIVAEIDRAAGISDIWRPLSMVPYATRNALWTLAPPLAVLLLGIQLGPDQRTRLLPVLFGIGIFSALLGILQLIGDPGGGLFFYRITNYGSAVGLFANRNHHAIFLASLPPMLLAWAALRSSRVQAPTVPSIYWACAAGGTLLVIPLILVAGSRSGLLSLALCLLALPAILVSWSAKGSQARPVTRRMPWLRPAALVLLLLAVVTVTALTLALGRGLALERLIGSDESDMRLRVLGPVLDMVRLYLPWGSGLGTFTEVYELHEPHRLLAPFYLNHAHSDWLELVMTGGLPALLLVATAVLAFLARLVQLLRPGTDDRDRVLVARVGVLILLMLGLASVGDYPLRTPSLACLAVIAALWAAPVKPCAVPADDPVSANLDKKRP